MMECRFGLPATIVVLLAYFAIAANATVSWDAQYECNVTPNISPLFDTVGGSDYSVSGGILTADTASGFHVFKTPVSTDWDSGLSTVEIRLDLSGLEANDDFRLEIGAGSANGRFKVEITRWSSGATALYLNDALAGTVTLSGFDVLRATVDVTNSLYNVYLNDDPTPVGTTNTLGSNENTRLLVGANGNSGVYKIDYLYWTTDEATAPVIPEPASVVLLGLWVAAVGWRRQH